MPPTTPEGKLRRSHSANLVDCQTDAVAGDEHQEGTRSRQFESRGVPAEILLISEPFTVLSAVQHYLAGTVQRLNGVGNLYRDKAGFGASRRRAAVGAAVETVGISAESH